VSAKRDHRSFIPATNIAMSLTTALKITASRKKGAGRVPAPSSATQPREMRSSENFGFKLKASS
jgi:hypothetical protein